MWKNLLESIFAMSARKNDFFDPVTWLYWQIPIFWWFFYFFNFSHFKHHETPENHAKSPKNRKIEFLGHFSMVRGNFSNLKIFSIFGPLGHFWPQKSTIFDGFWDFHLKNLKIENLGCQMVEILFFRPGIAKFYLNDFFNLVWGSFSRGRIFGPPPTFGALGIRVYPR